MSITVFSKSLGVEVDVSTYAKRKGYDVDSDPLLRGIPESFKRSTAKDIICSSCGAGNPIVVCGGLSGEKHVTQPHFRFLDYRGRESHHRNCEFHSEFSHSKIYPYYNTSIRESQKDVTYLIAELTSRALLLDVLTPADIKNFRAWFFELRKDGDVRVSATQAEIDAYLNLMDKGGEIDLGEPWQHNYLGLSFKTLERILTKQGSVLFDPRPLGEKYRLVARLLPRLNFLFRKSVPKNARIKASTAFVGLLLFAKEWQYDKAESSLNRILDFVGPVKHIANVVGFNPFALFSENCAAITISEVIAEHDIVGEINEANAKIASDLEKVRVEHPKPQIGEFLEPEIPF